MWSATATSSTSATPRRPPWGPAAALVVLLGGGLTGCYTDCDQAAFALRDCWNAVADCSEGTLATQMCTMQGASCTTTSDCPMDSQNWSCIGGYCTTKQPAQTLCLSYKNGDSMVGGGLTTNASASDRPDCSGTYDALADSVLSCTMSVSCETAADCPRDGRTWNCINYYCNAITPATCCLCPPVGK